MKKVVLIVLIIVMVVLMATAVGVTVYALRVKSADPVTGTLSTDSSIVLSMGETASASVVLFKNSPAVYPIVCLVSKSPKAQGNATLSIELEDTDVLSMDKVTVELYSDSECSLPIAGKSQTGEGVITMNDIGSSITYYALISIPNDLFDMSGIGGKMELSLSVAE